MDVTAVLGELLELRTEAVDAAEEICELVVAAEVVKEEVDEAFAAPDVENPITLLNPGSAIQRVPEGSNAIPAGVQRSDCVAVIDAFWFNGGWMVVKSPCPITRLAASPLETGAANSTTLLS